MSDNSTASAARWLRVQDVFAAAVNCLTAERASLLDRECADDPGLRQDVESLLAGHERPGLIDGLAVQLSAPARWRSRVDAMEWQGKRVAQYSVLEQLGAGGMGFVYKARDERLNRQVALKFLPPHLSVRADAKQRFLIEARAAAQLDHTNICTVHEIGETADGQLFISMPLYDGETLQERLDRKPPLSFVEAASIALQIANGLAKAHEHGVVHRDVKPSNVMLLPDGGVKVLDFGVARVEDASLATHEGARFGTVAYMSPEQASGERVDARSDVWSLGVVLYEMITGERPFRGDSAHALVCSVLSADPKPIAELRPDAPTEIDALLDGALAKAPEQRFATMTRMASALASLLEAGGFDTHFVGSSRDKQRSAVGERRRAAVLVCLVSDYAALVENLAPERLEDLMRQIRSLAVEVVRGHGGLVNHTLGEEIVALFGVPTAHEDDDLRAVRAALELQARIADLSAALTGELPGPVCLQAGVHAGVLVARRLNAGPQRYAVSGRAMQVAARLAALASEAAVLISAECMRLVAPFVQAEPQAPIAVDAESAPITPYRIVDASGLQTRLEAAARKGLTPLAGRHSELATIEAHFSQACAGRGQVVLVVGEAGVGKSRLLYELRERIRATQVRILEARCRSYGGVAPYLPFIDILRDALRLQISAANDPDANEIVQRIREIDRSLEQFAPLYLHLLSIPSETHALPRHLRGEHLRESMPEALAAILISLARGAPTVFLLEDWHWTDEGSGATLQRLMEIVSAHAIMIVITSRPEGVQRIDWAPRAACMPLTPLDFEASAAVMRNVLGVGRVSDELAQRVYQRTGGNPFFIEEVCHTLLEQGSIAARDGEGVAAAGLETLHIPDTVQAVIRTRLDSLDANSLEVLRVASVIGREFTQNLLIDAMGETARTPQALERLRSAGLIQQTSVAPEAAYRFKHALTQEVTYDSLLSRQRRSLHGVVGEAMERRQPQRSDEQAELLAYHFAGAEAWSPAVRYGRRAADRASALSQFADALAMLDRVQACLAHFPEGQERFGLIVDVLLQQERLCETLGQRNRQQHIVAELISLLAPRGASARLALAYLRQGDLQTLLKRFDAADRALSTALRLSRERGDAALERHALRSIGLLRWHEKRHEEALAITENALAIDRERRDDFAVAGDLANLGVIFKSMGDHVRALASFEEALSMPALAQDPSALVYSLHNLANAHRALGNLDRALEYLQQANEISRKHLLPIQRSFHLMAIAHILLQQNRVAESLQIYEESVELSRRARHADGLVQSLRALGEVLYGLGRESEALPYLQEAAGLFAQLEDPSGEVETLSCVAAILEKTGDAPDAVATWARVRNLRAALGDALGELDGLEGVARAIRRTAASPDEAIAHVAAALALAATLGARRREAALRNTLGILEWERGGYEAALRHYESALGLARELGDHAYEGLILNSLGVTLARLNRFEEARTALEDSVLLNRKSGHRLLEAHALAALGDVRQARGYNHEAQECFEQTLTLRRILEDRAGERHMLERLAQLRAQIPE
ncbi:MAG: serine/threonine-protein kinase PknK [Steroidobacter sp.]